MRAADRAQAVHALMHHDADLGDDILQHIDAHLDADGKVSLRLTCRAMRRSLSILGSTTLATVCSDSFDIDLSFVGRHLRSVRQVTLESARLAPLAALTPHLMGLTRLSRLSLNHPSFPRGPDDVYDLAPLACLTSLRELEMCAAEHTNLGALTQLDRLELPVTLGGPELSKLTSLRSLDITEECDAWELSSLQGLTRLEYGLHGMDPWNDEDSITTASEALEHLTSLRVLETPLHGEWALPSVVEQLFRLTQLSALCLHCFDQAVLPVAGTLDLSMLALQRLELTSFEGELAIVSPSLVCLCLETWLPGYESASQEVPNLRTCTSLQELTVAVGRAPAQFRITQDRLPLQVLRVTLKCKSQQQLLVQPGSRVQVQFIKTVPWMDSFTDEQE